MTSRTKLPAWFWILAIVILIWNLIGVASFAMSANQTKADLLTIGYNEVQTELMLSLPSWTKYFYLLATATGLIGAFGLILRKRFALPFFILSLLLAAFHHIYIYSTTEALYVMPLADKIITALVFILCFVQIWLSRLSRDRAWLR